MSTFEKFIPDNRDTYASPTRSHVQALVNIAFAALASFAIVGAAVYAIKLIL